MSDCAADRDDLEAVGREFQRSFYEGDVRVAAAAGISHGYLSQIELDEREPSLSIAARLARGLGISLDGLASGVADS